MQGRKLQQQFAAAEAEAQRDQPQQQLLQQPSTAGRGMRPAASAFMQQWNRQLLSKLQDTAGVSGLHVMPITGPSKRLALQLAQEGAFAPAAWPLAAGASAAVERERL
jgi:hypothetical protein